MMHFLQNSPRPDSYEVMAAAYAMASGLGEVERAADAYAREPVAALDMLRKVCEETRRDTLQFADSLWEIHQSISDSENKLDLTAEPFETILTEIRESEDRLDRGMAQHEIISEIMMPLRRATAKARSNVKNIVLLLRQIQPEEPPFFRSNTSPEALRALAEANTRLLHEKYG